MRPTICIIDDEPELAELCSDCLSSDFNVVTFNSGTDFLKAYDSNLRPAAIVSDFKMPEMTGIDLARSLNERKADIPFIVMTGYATKDNILQAIEQSVYGFIEKPFNPQKLKLTVDEALQRHQKSHVTPELLTKYGGLVKVLFDLNGKYSERYVAAENRLHELKASWGDKEDVRAFLSGLKEQKMLEKIIEEMVQEISQVK